MTQDGIAGAPEGCQDVFAGGAVASTGQSEKAAGEQPPRWIDAPASRATFNTSRPPRRWSDDPWCNMTTGEAEAWRRGVRDALYVAAEEAADREGGQFTEGLIRGALKRLAAGETMPAEGSDEDWPILRAMFSAIDVMEPPK